MTTALFCSGIPWTTSADVYADRDANGIDEDLARNIEIEAATDGDSRVAITGKFGMIEEHTSAEQSSIGIGEILESSPRAAMKGSSSTQWQDSSVFWTACAKFCTRRWLGLRT